MQYTDSSCSLALLIPTKDRFDELLLLLKRLEKEDPEVVCVYISDNASQDQRYCEELPIISENHPLTVALGRHQEPISANENWKSLLDIPSTKYLAFCGDDDFWEPGGLSKSIKWMEANRIDFTYPRRWQQHARILPGQETIYKHLLPALPKKPLERVLTFYRYDNDPMVYGIFELTLMKKMFENFRSGWRLLPKAHNADAAYLGVISALLYAKNPEWNESCYHSQGIEVQAITNWEAPRARHYIAIKTNAYYIIRKIQLIIKTISMASRVSPGTPETLWFSLQLLLIVIARIPILVAAKKDFALGIKAVRKK